MKRLDLYQYAVQDPDRQAAVLAAIYQHCRPGLEALRLREDFAGNAADARAWLAADPRRSAVAVEADRATLRAARRAAAADAMRARLQLIEADVTRLPAAAHAPVDLLCALNYSIGYLHRRPVLVDYLRRARQALAPQGVIVLNTFGGAAALQPGVMRHPIEPPPEAALPAFDYCWEVRDYDPISARIDCRIHFEWRDRRGRPRAMPDAFVYRWRLWSPMELMEAMHEAGYVRARAWRHTASTRGGRTSVRFGPIRRWPQAQGYSLYVVGEVGAGSRDA